MRAMFDQAGIYDSLRDRLWAEAANMSVQIDNILVNKKYDKCPYERFTRRLPGYVFNLRTFGEMCVVIDQKQKKIRSKLKNRGKMAMMVGYHQQHAGDVYRLYDINTCRIITSRDVRWTNKSYGQFMRENSRDVQIDEIDDEGESEDDFISRDQSEPNNNDVSRNNFKTRSTGTPVVDRRMTRSMSSMKLRSAAKKYNTLRKANIANILLNEMDEYAFVGVTDDNYVNPEKFEEAWNHTDIEERKNWRAAIKKEFDDMINKNVWSNTKKDLVPTNRRLIGCKWVFKVKKNGVYRARLVALGYSQIAGIDHQDNYAPVVVDVTFRLVMVLALINDWKYEIVDVETAFLYGELEETIFMKIPEGINYYYDRDAYGAEDCFELTKSIYGLVQAARQFYKKLIRILTENMGFTKCLSDQCLLMKNNDDGVVIVCIYIDDTLCVGDQSAIDTFKRDIQKFFSTKEEGKMEDYVGCQVSRNGDKMWMYQQDLINKIRKHFKDDVREMRKYDTPAGNLEYVIRPSDDTNSISSIMQTKYRSGIGMMLFLVKYSRPDIANCIRELSKANGVANESHYKSLMRAIKYVLDSEKYCLTLMKVNTGEEEMTWFLKAFSDSDWAGNKDGRRSVTGYCIYLNGNLVAWKSRSQKNVTLSSSEAEYVAVSEVCTEIMFIKMILTFLNVEVQLPIKVHCDNVGAIFLSYNPKTSARTKHIDIKYHHVREHVVDGIVMIEFVKSEENDADIFTKNTNKETHERHSGKMMKQREN